MKRFLNLFILIVFYSIHSYASHILGGTMTYNYIGDNEYEINLILFRDACSGGAQFDQNAAIGIFQNDSLIQSDLIYIDSIVTLGVPSFQNCESLGQSCIQKGRYTFTKTLPISEYDYTIVYQRCCFSSVVLNITNPTETGLSITTVIPVAAQGLQNTQSSPDFSLAFLSCPYEAAVIPIPQVDEDGDSIVFEVCLPYQGGGLDIDAPSGSCSSPGPNPPCPPPYNEIELLEGFSASNPFPTVDGFHFDSINNTINFIPTTLGQYIFSLCVSEYREGVLLGRNSYNMNGSTSPDYVPIQQIVNNEKVILSYLEQENSIQIEIEENEDLKIIRLINLLGQEYIYRLEAEKTLLNINTLDLSKGIYVINISSNNKSIYTKKVIVR